MQKQQRMGLDALRPNDPRWATALNSVRISSNREKQDAAAFGLGSAIEQRRERKAVNRKLVNARRKHSRATR